MTKCALFLYLATQPQPVAIVYPMTCEMNPGYPFEMFLEYSYGPVPAGFSIEQAMHDPKWERAK